MTKCRSYDLNYPEGLLLDFIEPRVIPKGIMLLKPLSDFARAFLAIIPGQGVTSTAAKPVMARISKHWMSGTRRLSSRPSSKLPM